MSILIHQLVVVCANIRDVAWQYLDACATERMLSQARRTAWPADLVIGVPVVTSGVVRSLY